jgi:hypothetical protein
MVGACPAAKWPWSSTEHPRQGSMRNPEQLGHPFRLHPATESGRIITCPTNWTVKSDVIRLGKRILSVKETCRLQSASTFQILTQAVEDFFKGHRPDTAWLLQN